DLILEFLSTLRFGEAVLDLDAPGTIQFQLGGARRRLSWRISPFLQFDQRSGVETFPSDDGIRYCWEESGTRKARLAAHFGLLTTDILGGLTVIVPKLPIIDMGELVRLWICMEVDDTWAWVAMGPERQLDAAASASVVAEDAPAADEGDQAVLAPVQAPQQPPPLPQLLLGLCRRD
ncbi:hypothetical protein Tco_0030269, partial [Tanacetum coccineum]